MPLIDIDLVKLAWKIPSRFKVKKTTSKYVFKRAMEPFLPRDVIYRPKTGFVAPIREWLQGRLLEQVRETLSHDALTRRGWFSASAVGALFEKIKTHDVQYLIWTLYTLEEWARMFIDGERPDNLQLIRFEELSNTFPEAVKDYLVAGRDAQFPMLNASGPSTELQSLLDEETRELIYHKHRYMFDKGYYSTDWP